jgi:large subunit ribosomal protein L23
MQVTVQGDAATPSKPEIKAAVELMFKVEVKPSVSVVNVKGKTKRFGKSRRPSRPRSSKAYVTLKPGQELQPFG